MITFEKAYEIAKIRMKNISSCNEYQKGYVFFPNEGKGEGKNTDGIGHVVIAVTKEDGKPMLMSQFVMEGTGKYVGGVDLETGARIERDEDE